MHSSKITSFNFSKLRSRYLVLIVSKQNGRIGEQTCETIKSLCRITKLLDRTRNMSYHVLQPLLTPFTLSGTWQYAARNSTSSKSRFPPLPNQIWSSDCPKTSLERVGCGRRDPDLLTLTADDGLLWIIGSSCTMMSRWTLTRKERFLLVSYLYTGSKDVCCAVTLFRKRSQTINCIAIVYSSLIRTSAN